MEEENACEIVNSEPDAKPYLYLCKKCVSQIKLWTSQKTSCEIVNSEPDAKPYLYLCKKWVSQIKIVNFSEKQERAKMRELYKGYKVKGEVSVKQHENGDRNVIKSLKNIDKI